MDTMKPQTGEGYELEDTFERFLGEIEKYYPEEWIYKFKDWHTRESLEEKIRDPKRFFRVIRDGFGNIIAYFESKEHSSESSIQVIQWFFVSEKYRKNGLLKELMGEFEHWCKSNNYTSIWSYSALRNNVSNQIHSQLFDETDIVDMDSWNLQRYRKSL